MIKCIELDKEFQNKEDLFKALKENKKNIINVKRKNIYTGYNLTDPEQSKQTVANSQIKLKALENCANKNLFQDNQFYYFAVNTTNILDSHNDLHVKGIWNKTAKEQNGKNYLVDTHSLTMKDIIAYPEDIEIFVADIPFKALGLNYRGDTEALIYKVHKENIMGEDIRDALNKRKTFQASVKMQYVKMELAMNSEAKEDAEEKKTFINNIGLIANIQDFKEEPLYFFIQKEAKNIQESSLVPFGSNHATGQLNKEIKEPTKVTQLVKEPSIDTQKVNQLLSNLKFKN